VVVTTDLDTFLDIGGKRTSPEAAVKKGQLAVEGDPDAIIRAGNLFSVSQPDASELAAWIDATPAQKPAPRGRAKKRAPEGASAR
jgi:hypothetical protein